MIRSAVRVIAMTDHPFLSYKWRNHDRGLYHMPIVE
jgi:hypothetical protein